MPINDHPIYVRFFQNFGFPIFSQSPKSMTVRGQSNLAFDSRARQMNIFNQPGTKKEFAIFQVTNLLPWILPCYSNHDDHWPITMSTARSMIMLFMDSKFGTANCWKGVIPMVAARRPTTSRCQDAKPGGKFTSSEYAPAVWKLGVV